MILTRIAWMNTMPYVIRALDRRPQQRGRRVGLARRDGRRLVGHARRGVPRRRARAAARLPAARDLILFLTFAVILATLVVQGLTLPVLIRRLGVRDDGAEEREELLGRRAAADAALASIGELADEDWTRDDTVERMRGALRLPPPPAARREQGESDDGDGYEHRSRKYQKMVREVLDAQRRRDRPPAQPGRDLQRGHAPPRARARPRGRATRDLRPCHRRRRAAPRCSTP